MLNRRDAMVRLGSLGVGGLALPNLLQARASEPAAKEARADSCILIYLWGGPPQHDTFDPKPDAPDGVRGLFAPLNTNVPGVRFTDRLPLLARQADKLAVVRSLTHGSDIHEESVYHTLTGRAKKGLVVPRNARRRTDFPFFGSVAARFAAPADLPASVTVPRPIGHDGVTYSGTHAGFLGPRYDPFEPAAAPDTRERPAHEIAVPGGMDATRLIARRGLLRLIEDQDRKLQSSKAAGELAGFRDQAFRMVSSPAARRAFDLTLEPEKVRNRYGRNEYGESFLLARRLVESGVRMVSVIWMYVTPSGKVANVWDNHGGTGVLGGVTGYAMLDEKYCLPPLDRGLSALLEDLDARGLLSRTLVLAMGEFGRTPKINKTVGRDHWGACQSIVLAGGGVRGGQVLGSSDAQGAFPVDNPVSPADVIATVHHAMGLPADAEVIDRENRPHRVSEGRAIAPLFG